MSRFVSVCAVLVLAVSITAGAQGNVTGAWDLSINGPQGPITAAATLQQAGEDVTGTIESPQGTVPVKGTLKGKTLALMFSVDGPQGPLEIKVNGEVEGDSISGMLDFGMGQADFTAAKKK